jgi:hypothetical protein
MCAQSLINIDRYPRFTKYFDQKPTFRCEVHPLRPQLNYGFYFVSGYVGHLPLKRYGGEGHRFAVLTRVTSQDHEHPPVYLSQFFRTPRLPGKTHSNLELDGAFFTGPGRYKVEWLVVDREGGLCRTDWQIDAKSPHADEEMTVSLPPGVVTPVRYGRWSGPSGGSLRITILLHVAPFSPRRLKLRPYDQTMLLSSVLAVLDRMPVAQVKLIAFNLDQQQELFRSDDLDSKGWDDLVGAISKVNFLTVPVSVLLHRNGHLDVVRRLIEDELAAAEPSDLVLFLGPTARQTEKLRFSTENDKPSFWYFEYKPNYQRGAEFPDILSNTVRGLSGKVVRIYNPHDFFVAMNRMQTIMQIPRRAGF